MKGINHQNMAQTHSMSYIIVSTPLYSAVQCSAVQYNAIVYSKLSIACIMTYEYRTYRELAILNSGVIAVAPAPDKNVPSLACERILNIKK